MTLAARIEIARGAFALRAELDVANGEVLAVVGPNGAGKTTLLRALAGLDRLDAGVIRLDDRVLDAPADAVFVPPADRSVGYLFQDHRLFPHLSVLDNAAFGLRARGVARDVARRRAAEWLAHVDASDLADRRPDALSGGQAQRVALARALATEPRLLLLDEPLAAIDAASAVALRRLLVAELLARSGPALVVTHDPVEAAVLGTRIAVVEGGCVVQQGSAAEIAARPRTDYVAELVGVNLFRGRVEASVLALASGGRLHVATALRGDVVAIVHPRAVALHARRPEGSPRNVWAATVESIEPAGDRVRVRMRGEIAVVAEITAAAARELALAAGRELWVSVKATEISVGPD